MSNLVLQLRQNAEQALLNKSEEERLCASQRKESHTAWVEKVYSDTLKDVLDRCNIAASFGQFEMVYTEQNDQELLQKIQRHLDVEENLQSEVKHFEGNPLAFLHDLRYSRYYLRYSRYYLVISWKERTLTASVLV